MEYQYYKNIKVMDEEKFYDNELTRINPDTNFVIEKKSGLIRWIYKKHRENAVIENLMSMYGIGVKNMRRNRYGDIILM